MEDKTKTEAVVAEAKEASVESPLTKSDFKELVEELVAKQAEHVKSREKKFELTGSKSAELELFETKKRSKMVDFFNAMARRDKGELAKISEDRRAKEFRTILNSNATIEEKQLMAKALNEGTGSAGGYLVPEEFEREVLRLMNDYSAIRQDATKVTMTTDVRRLNDLITNPTVRQPGELGVITGSQPVFAEPVLTAIKYIGTSGWSTEVAEDEENNLIRAVQEAYAEEFAQAEEVNFVESAVSGSQGLLTVSGVTSTDLISGSTFASITWDDLAAMQSKMAQDVSNVSAQKGTFYMSPYVYNILRTQKTTDNAYILPPVPTLDAPAMAWGHPIKLVQSFPSSTATGTKFVVFTELKKTGYIGDRTGMTVKIFDTGTYIDSDGSEVNLLSQDAEAIRIRKRTAWCTRLQTGIVTLATN